MSPQVYIRPQAARRTVGGGAGASSGELGSLPADDDLQVGLGGTGPAVYKFFFNIGSVDAFEHAMEDAQDALGVDPSRWGGRALIEGWTESQVPGGPAACLAGLALPCSNCCPGLVWCVACTTCVAAALLSSHGCGR